MEISTFQDAGRNLNRPPGPWHGIQ